MKAVSSVRGFPLGLRLLTFYLAFAQVSCITDGGGTIGPCVHTNEEPILHIEWARNAKTGEYLRTVVLTEMAIDSFAQDPFWFLPDSRGVAVADSSLICNPPCAFGNTTGKYTFTVSAPGCRDTIVTCYPRYAINRGGCPSSSTGGLRLTLMLPGQ
jgi:hypothetical protein